MSWKVTLIICSMAITGWVSGKLMAWTIRAYHLGIIEYNTMLTIIAACITPVIIAAAFLVKKRKSIEKWVEGENIGQ